MPTYDPMNELSPEAASEHFSYADPRLEGRVWEISLQPLDYPLASLAVDVYRDMVEMYITGGPNQPKVDFPATRGPAGVLVPSKTLFRQAAEIFVMQAPRPGEDGLSFESICWLSKKLPETWEKLVTFAQEINLRYEEGLKKSSPVVTAA